MKSLTHISTKQILRQTSVPLLLAAAAAFTPLTASVRDGRELPELRSLSHPTPQDARILLAAREPDAGKADSSDSRDPDPRHEDREERRDDAGPDERDRRDRGDNHQNMDMLDRLLAMPPEHLSRIRQAIERIEAMTPVEREALRERLRDFRDISPEQQRSMRKKWRELSHEERRKFIQRMHEHRWNQVFEEDESELPPLPGAPTNGEGAEATPPPHPPHPPHPPETAVPPAEAPPRRDAGTPQPDPQHRGRTDPSREEG